MSSKNRGTSKNKCQPSLCSECMDVVNKYLMLASDQEDSIRLIVGLCSGVISDEGLDRETLARFGVFLKQFLARRAALDSFFFEDGTDSLGCHDKGIIQAEWALIR